MRAVIAEMVVAQLMGGVIKTIVLAREESVDKPIGIAPAMAEADPTLFQQLICQRWTSWVVRCA